MPVKTIPISSIMQSEETLRPVDTDNEQFQELMQSIKSRGIMNPPNVRPVESDDGTERYALVDGLQRYTCASILGFDELGVNVLEDAVEEDTLELQIEANLHRVDTKPIQYTRALQQIMLNHPERTIEEQARRLSKSVGWLRDRLSLNLFEGRAAELIDEGKLPLSNAYALAKIAKQAPDEVEDWLDRATSLPPSEFIPDALAREKELKAEKKGKKSSKPAGPTPKLRKLGDIKAEFTRAKAAASAKNATEHQQGYYEALRWVLQQDDVTIEQWKKAEAERQKQKEERKKEREAEKEGKAQERKQLGLKDLVKGL